MALTRSHAMIFCIFAIVAMVSLKLYTDKEEYKSRYQTELSARAYQRSIVARAGQSAAQNVDTLGLAEKSDDVFLLISQLIQQRNNLSRAMNLKQQTIAQKECEEIARSKETHKVSTTGGWCAHNSKENSGQHKTDFKLVPVLAQFFKGKKVGSFGDGPGRYKQLLTDTGLLERYDAYDGAPFCEQTSEGRVAYLDLTLPQYGLPLYDWIISLEVAEHIPKEYESVYLDNIVRHAKEGVVLSWAKPGQEGYSHINNRPFDYVKNVFEKLGFNHDKENSEKLQKASKLEWLQWNTNVYRRRNDSKIEQLKTFLT